MSTPTSPAPLSSRARSASPPPPDGRGAKPHSPLRLRSRSPTSPNRPEWAELPADAYRALPLLLKTLRGVEVDRNSYEQKKFVQYTADDLERDLLVTVDAEGRLCISAAQKTITAAGDGMIFVMHKTGKIYATTPIDEYVFHSSMTIPGAPDYQDPIATGTFTALDGIPKEFSEKSGHFAPSGCLPAVLAKLHSEGCHSLLTCKIRENSFRPVSPEERASPDSMTRQERLNDILRNKASTPPPIPDSKDASPPSPERRLQPKAFAGFPSLGPVVADLSQSARKLSISIRPPSQVPLNPSLERTRSLLLQEAAAVNTPKDAHPTPPKQS